MRHGLASGVSALLSRGWRVADEPVTAIHAHHRASTYGSITGSWESMTDAITYARDLTDASQTTIRCLDLGGGFDEPGLGRPTIGRRAHVDGLSEPIPGRNRPGFQ